MSKPTVMEQLNEILPGVPYPTGLESCVLGYVEVFGKSPVILLDREAVIKTYMKDGMSEEDAEEYFEFNVLGAYVGEDTPAFATILKKPQVEIIQHKRRAACLTP